MDEVTVRKLHDFGGEVLDQVLRGESLVVSRDGTAVAVLQPLPLPRVSPSAAQLIERRRRLPRVDLASLRADLDEVLDPPQ